MDSQTAIKLSYMENDAAELSGADRLRLAKRIFEIRSIKKTKGCISISKFKCRRLKNEKIKFYYGC